MNHMHDLKQPELNPVVDLNGQTLELKAFKSIYRSQHPAKIHYWVLGTFAGLILLLFLPWTQNVRAKGTVTTLRQEQRPQQLNTIIGGRVKQWYVKEGDLVKAGDTIIQLSEIKEDYLDPELLQRTQEQLTAKEEAIKNYSSKASTAVTQVDALLASRDFKLSEINNKLQQQVMKITADSIDMLAALNDLKIKNDQYQRQVSMYDSGLVSLTQLEQRNQARQDAIAKKTSNEIKFNNSRQEYLRLKIEQQGVLQDYAEKISKAQGDRFQSLSMVSSGASEVAKLKNQFRNYSIRNGMYYITAPQDGQIVQARKAGLGEIVKEGEMIVEIVPRNLGYAVELFVKPLDLPLLHSGQKIRFVFDGFPAIVFSGWPQASYGTFGGEITAVENALSPNGNFRLIVRPDESDKPWPVELKLGTGAQGIALLKDVPIWYELWRNINGFPPDYYKLPGSQDSKKPKEDK